MWLIHTRPLRALVTACCLAAAAPAAAQLDVTGTWAVSIDGGFAQMDPFEQSGTTLSSWLLGYGTIDPSTGVFHLERSGECTLPGDDDPSTIEGTVSADGRTFAGAYSVLVIGTPSHPCVRLEGGVSGTLVRGRQTLLGKSLTVRDPKPGDPTKRSIVGSASEKNSPDTVASDPTLSGGILQVFANGTASSAQEFTLPQGTSGSGRPFWSGSAAEGFKYRDAGGEQGPVKKINLKRSASGSFSLKVAISGRNGVLNVLPPGPGTDGCLALQLEIDPITPSDRYSVRFGPESTITNSGATLFKASRPTAEGHCPTL